MVLGFKDEYKLGYMDVGWSIIAILAAISFMHFSIVIITLCIQLVAMIKQLLRKRKLKKIKTAVFPIETDISNGKICTESDAPKSVVSFAHGT